jgi:hypothetical protein
MADGTTETPRLLAAEGLRLRKWWPINKATDIKANEPLAMQ